MTPSGSPRPVRRSCRPTAETRPAGAQGLLASDWFEARLVDPETDLEVPVGAVGEFVVRYKHPWTCSLGYYGMPEKTAEAWRNLWFHTGDALRRDAEGWYYFVDRYKDTLRRRGENISSYEVEQVDPEPSRGGRVRGHRRARGRGGRRGRGDGRDHRVRAGRCRRLWAWCEGRVPGFAIPQVCPVRQRAPPYPVGEDQEG